MRTSQVAAGSTHQPFTFYVAGGALYLAITSSPTACLSSPKRARRAACGAKRTDHGPALHLDHILAPARRAAGTLSVWALSVFFGAFIAAGVTWMRGSGIKPAEWIARAYIFVFRGAPLLVQLFVVYYGLSSFPLVRARVFWPFLRDAFNCATLSCALCTPPIRARSSAARSPACRTARSRRRAPAACRASCCSAG